ncbi:regulatory protein [Roseibium hamelinense]|uniref:Regulatory protein RecX n=1 Tax=Roseibium hamelinense TaxID=150831 RepID=A0A562TJM0_9HYPH|nr:regulatory protein RecX [Roseibium hamelinense]MTI45838.1 regulatory protein RecX [Roseibium hamelinense]TWI92980.1 regulatory protein [Roseibium hamelinense]
MADSIERKKRKLPTEERLQRAALHYLDRYVSSSANLRRVLERKVIKAARDHGTSPQDYIGLIDTVVEKCERTGLIDDTRYAETKLASMRRKGRSERQIKQYLSSKGVSPETVSSVLEQDGTSEMEAAIRYAQRRRLGPFSDPSKRAARQEKDMAALCRAGFSYAISRRVIADQS